MKYDGPELNGMTKNERIKWRKENLGLKDRHSRKLEKFSDNFNEIFNFFINSYLKGILSFAGVAVETKHDKSSYSAKEAFRRYDDGQFGNGVVPSRQSNIVKGVITAKKSWGLFLDQWAQGIAECSFTREEIINEFESKGIKIPKPFLIDFENRIRTEQIKFFTSLKD